MLKISRLSFSRGLIKKSGVSYGLFKPAKTEEEQHRQARDYPWWRNGAIAVGLIVFVNVCSLAFYNGNRWYQSWRPSGNDIYINSSIDKLLFSRPDLAVVSVKCLLHHALTGTTTPFADPIVAPPGYKQEVDELVAFVEELHHNQPLYSIPDLWAMITCKALSRLGGPIITPYRGREATSGTTVVFKESLVQENKRDVLNMKRVLVKQGYSLDQLVAIMGCLRSIGFHDSANFHTKEEIKPSFRNTGVVGPKAGDFVIPDTTEKTTLDPYVFGSDYFDLLLDYNWKKGIFSNSSVFRCSAKDKRRDIVLLDPFSARTAESIGELEKAKEKAQNDSDSFYQKKMP
ncbi:hypothetical protein AGDE_00546 [Angomonas deanei]|nr:hypothetical protein AGDE_00546 [Angomonas deanei]|eukprot:EPY43375.1 hypothetical protein AGDE_00546 [Angomonas deanei]